MCKYKSYSVLMSVYKKEKAEYFEQAIESIQAQTLPTNDFVLICDGPLTLELDTVIKTKRQEMGNVLTVIRLPENKGLGNALRIGLKHCKNELVARMDSDDICAPDRMEKQIAYLKEHPDVDVLGGNIEEFIGEQNNVVGIRDVPVEH